MKGIHPDVIFRTVFGIRMWYNMDVFTLRKQINFQMIFLKCFVAPSETTAATFQEESNADLYSFLPFFHLLTPLLLLQTVKITESIFEDNEGRGGALFAEGSFLIKVQRPFSLDLEPVLLMFVGFVLYK
jgi:hypothetical protein